jgi:hypothetical protein
MKKQPFVFAIILALAAFASAQQKFETYSNERFFFSIDYPSDLLKIEPPPENDDGRTFVSSDGQVEMLVWGQHNVQQQTLDERYAVDLKGFTEKPAYMVLKRDWFVLSGMKNGKIFYEKTLVRRKGGDVFFTFTITYPPSQKSKFDAIVKRIADSFKFDPDPDA